MSIGVCPQIMPVSVGSAKRNKDFLYFVETCHFHFNISTHREQQKIYGRWRYVRQTDVKLLRFTPERGGDDWKCTVCGSACECVGGIIPMCFSYASGVPSQRLNGLLCVSICT